jgi:formylglycine-generating enzyme required for sulfatase activity
MGLLVGLLIALLLLRPWATVIPEEGMTKSPTDAPRTRPKPDESESNKADPFFANWATPLPESSSVRAVGFPQRVKRIRDGMTMVLVPAGKFPMGAIPNDRDASDEESPRHEIELTKPYYIDECEVTRGMWHLYSVASQSPMPTAPADETDDSYPITWVSWNQVQGYLAWANVNLPTEAQWERAARGGVDDRVYSWDGEDDPRMRNGPIDVASRGLDKDGFSRQRSPVKSFPANAFGLYDMIGNEEEMCADYFDESYYKVSPRIDPTGPTDARPLHSVRSGGWDLHPERLRVSSRGYVHRDRAVCGFRCAKSVP